MRRKSGAFFWVATFLLGLLYAVPAFASPRVEMQTILDQLVNIVEQLPGEQNQVKRRDELRKVIEPKFDFREMAQRSLGSHWKEITAAQQDEFVDAFSELLARTYLARIENVRSKMVSIKDEKVRGSKAYVKTMVDYKGDTFPIDYKLVSKAGQWKVYDVVIENIGLVTNYRNEFSGIIRQREFSGLLETLQKKVAKNSEQDAR